MVVSNRLLRFAHGTHTCTVLACLALIHMLKIHETRRALCSLFQSQAPPAHVFFHSIPRDMWIFAPSATLESEAGRCPVDATAQPLTLVSQNIELRLRVRT